MKSTVLNRSAAIFAAIPIPTPLANPWPSGPVVTSTPTVWPNSGCPGVLLPHWRKFLISSIGRSKPNRCSSEYWSMEPCPAESMKRSRFSQAGSSGLNSRKLPQRATAQSAAPIGRPGWPELALSIASADRIRMASAQRRALAAGIMMCCMSVLLLTMAN